MGARHLNSTQLESTQLKAGRRGLRGAEVVACCSGLLLPNSYLVDEEGADCDEGENDEHTASHDDLGLEDAHMLATRLLDRLGRLTDHRVQAGLCHIGLALAHLDNRARPELLARARLALRVLTRDLPSTTASVRVA